MLSAEPEYKEPDPPGIKAPPDPVLLNKIPLSKASKVNEAVK